MFFCILVMCVVFIVIVFLLFFFFIKQKPAYEMRIRDWSSDVCSSDLVWRDAAVLPVISGSFLGDVGVNATPLFRGPLMLSGQVIDADATQFTRTLSFPRNVVIQTRTLVSGAQESERIAPQIGSASSRERVSQ